MALLLLGAASGGSGGASRLPFATRSATCSSSANARQRLAREFGATDIVTERGDEGVDRIKDLTKGPGDGEP